MNILLLFVGNDCHLLKKYYFSSDLKFCFLGSFNALLRELVAEFTLTDNSANTTTSLLRSLCHYDDSVLLGSWLQETDHKSIEDQVVNYTLKWLLAWLINNGTSIHCHLKRKYCRLRFTFHLSFLRHLKISS